MSGMGIICDGEDTIIHQNSCSKERKLNRAKRRNSISHNQTVGGSTGGTSAASNSFQTSMLTSIMNQLDPNKPMEEKKLDLKPEVKVEKPAESSNEKKRKENSKTRSNSKSNSKPNISFKNVLPKINTNLKRCQSDFGRAPIKEYDSCNNEIRFNQVMRLGGDKRLDDEININIGRHIQGEIRSNVENKYADLEKLLSSNLGDKLQEVCEI